MGRWLVLSVWLGAVAAAGAATGPEVNPLAQLYLRVTNRFALADFFKPIEPPAPDPSFTLAPLILQEVRGEPGPQSNDGRFGMLIRSNGVLRVDTSRPVVYVELGTLAMKERSYAQLTYLWAYSQAEPGATMPGIRLQGFRLTLDRSGQSAIWEVLADDSGADLFFVSQNLEAVAEAEWRKPLPGRRYAIEQGRVEAPKVIVARVLGDPPMPMGPMVYLQAGTQDASTLLCRCMPAQAKVFRQTTVYRLIPLSALRSEGMLDEARARAKVPPAFWPGNGTQAQHLEDCLRLPSSF